jgi:hypothetical protein
MMRVLLAAALVVALAGCKGRDDQVQTKAPKDATAAVEALQQRLVTDLGEVSAVKGANTDTVPCEAAGGEVPKDGRYYVLGAYQFEMPLSEHFAALGRLRDTLAAQGWQITEFRPLTSGGGALSARNPADGFGFTLTTAGTQTSLGALITSACYRPPSRDMVNF